MKVWYFMYDPETKKRQSATCFEPKVTESSENENAKMAGENNVHCIIL
jgi:hypothetical protein